MAEMENSVVVVSHKGQRKKLLNIDFEDFSDVDDLLQDSGSEYCPSTEVDSMKDDNIATNNEKSRKRKKTMQKCERLNPCVTTEEVNNLSLEETDNHQETQSESQLMRQMPNAENGNIIISVKPVKMNMRKEKKRLRNSGLEYKSVRSQKLVEKRETGKDCNCKKKCYENIEINIREKVFSEFWNMGNYDLQNSYLSGRIKIIPVKRRYPDKGSKSRRSNSVSYSILKESTEIEVCKVAFLNMHCLQKSRGRVELLVKKLSTGINTPPLDQRGQHDSRQNLYTEAQKDSVYQHINKIPKYVSHYSRKDNPDKVYIGHEYSIASMYSDYSNKFCVEIGINPVSLDMYRKSFRKLNIGFKHPKSDTCKLCDSYHLKIKELKAKNDIKSLNEVKLQQELHHRKSQAGLDMMKDMRRLAKEDSDTYVFTFDLQQALPLPKLSTGPAFYCRKIWCYNLSIHDCKTEKGFFYVWDEPVAGRGSEEIVSCLKKHFETFNIKGKKLILISDNCGGQNKNWSVVAFWSYLLSCGRFECIEHHFPISGHTMLPSDQDFGVIEKYVRKHVQVIYTPDEWVNAIQNSSVKKSFTVTKMTEQDFVSLTELKKYFTFRTKTVEKEPVKFKEAVVFSLSVDCPMKLKLRYHYNGLDDTVNLCPRGQLGQPCMAVFPQKNQTRRKIDPVKMKDIMSLKAYIPDVYYKNYYMKLTKGHRIEGELDEEENDSMENETEADNVMET